MVILPYLTSASPVDLYPWIVTCPCEAYRPTAFSAYLSTACVYNAPTNSAVILDVTPSHAIYNASDTERTDKLNLETIDYLPFQLL